MGEIKWENRGEQRAWSWKELKVTGYKNAKHKREKEGGGQMRNRCREWEARTVPLCVYLSLSCWWWWVTCEVGYITEPYPLPSNSFPFTKQVTLAHQWATYGRQATHSCFFFEGVRPWSWCWAFPVTKPALFLALLSVSSHLWLCCLTESCSFPPTVA